MSVRRAEQYRKFAKQCLQYAKAARTELERDDFLDMAQASTRAAAEYDGVPDWAASDAYGNGPSVGQETRGFRVRHGAKEA